MSFRLVHRPPTQQRIAKVRELARELDRLEAERSQLNDRIRVLINEIGSLMNPDGSAESSSTVEEPESDEPVMGLFAKEAQADTDTDSETETAQVRSYAELALRAIAANPNVSTAELASRLYGTADEKARNRARSVLYFLRNRRRIQRTQGGGAWEILHPGNGNEGDEKE